MKIRRDLVIQSYNTGFAPNSTTYQNITSATGGGVALYESGNFVSPTIYLEAVIKSVTATSNDTYVKLVDIGANVTPSASGSDVGSSEIISASTTRTVVRSSSLSLTSGNNFKVMVRNEATASTTQAIYYATIVVVDEIGTSPSVLTNYIYLMGGEVSTPSTSYVEDLGTARWVYDSSKYDGTITCYFQAIMRNSTTNTSYVELWNFTDSAQVAQLSVTGTTNTRLRSSSFSLTNGKEYGVRIKVNASSTCYLDGACLIINQSGTITKSRIYMCMSYLRPTTSTTYYSSIYASAQKYDSTDWTNTSPTWYSETCQSITNASYTAYSAACTIGTTTVLTNTENTTTSTTKVIQTNASSCSPSSGTVYVSSSHSSSVSGTVNYTGVRLFTDETWSAGTVVTRSYACIFG